MLFWPTLLPLCRVRESHLLHVQDDERVRSRHVGQPRSRVNLEDQKYQVKPLSRRERQREDGFIELLHTSTAHSH